MDIIVIIVLVGVFLFCATAIILSVLAICAAAGKEMPTPPKQRVGYLLRQREKANSQKQLA